MKLNLKVAYTNSKIYTLIHLCFLRIFISISLVVFYVTVSGQPTQPILRIETGMNNARSWRISTDVAGKYLLTCSDDKTARFWDASTGVLLNTFRIPVGEISEGKIFSCSLSPDGKMAALGGSTGFEWDSLFCIYIINTQTGDILHRLKGLPAPITDLEFSPDAKWLAAGLDNGKGVRIFHYDSWKEYKKLEAHSGRCFNIAFKPGGGLASVSQDGKIRLYNNRFELVTEKIGMTGNQRIYSLAFNPSGTLLAIGYADTITIEVRDATDLSLKYSPSILSNYGEKGTFAVLSFSADGSKLYSAGTFKKADINGQSIYGIRCWNEAGMGSYSNLFILKNTALDIKPLPNGSLAVLAASSDIAVISSLNQTIWYRAPGNDNDANIGENWSIINKSNFKINDSGTLIGYTPRWLQAYSFDVLQRKLVEETSLYTEPVETHNGTTVTDWANKKTTAINGNPVTFFNKNEPCRSTDINSSGKQIILGSSTNLYLLDNNAKMIWKTDLPGSAYAVNISGNDRVVAAALADGTIRWYSMTDGKELLAFYIHTDKKRWVLFSPSGYYDASPGAEDFLGWHLNNGPDNIPSFFPVSRFREQYYRPDIIDLIFETNNESKAISIANMRKEKKGGQIQIIDITKKTPPSIIISSPINGSTVNDNVVSISYTIHSPADAPAKNIKVLVNGRPVKIERAHV